MLQFPSYVFQTRKGLRRLPKEREALGGSRVRSAPAVIMRPQENLPRQGSPRTREANARPLPSTRSGCAPARVFAPRHGHVCSHLASPGAANLSISVHTALPRAQFWTDGHCHCRVLPLEVLPSQELFLLTLQGPEQTLPCEVSAQCQTGPPRLPWGARCFRLPAELTVPGALEQSSCLHTIHSGQTPDPQ